MQKTAHQYRVKADPTTGEWLNAPEYVGEVQLSEWLKKTDTELSHFDTIEAHKNFDGISAATHAIEVVWAH